MPVREPVNLSAAGPGNFRRTRGRFFEALWILAEFLLVSNPLQPSSRLRIWALRTFGAEIGSNVIARPRLRVKFPWNLRIGGGCWIGEGVWIHNQGSVEIEDNVVVSQEAFITTGSHDMRKSMDLVIKPVRIRSGAWVTARSIVLQEVEIGENAVITPGSVVHRSVDPDGVYGGNPARLLRSRWQDKP